MTNIEKMEVIKTARQQVNTKNNTKSIKDIQKIYNDGDAKRAADIQKEINVLMENNRRGDIVRFIQDGNAVEGIIDTRRFKGKVKYFEVSLPDGSVAKVPPRNILRNLGKSAPRSLDDIEKLSDITSDFVKSSDDFVVYTNKVIDDIIEKPFTDMSDDLVGMLEKDLDEYVLGKEKISKELIKFEREFSDLQGLERVMVNNEKGLEILQEEIDKFDELLNNKNAFETYIRTKFLPKGTSDKSTTIVRRNINAMVDEAVSKANPHMGEYILSDKINASDKAKKVVDWLRSEFVEIGK